MHTSSSPDHDGDERASLFRAEAVTFRAAARLGTARIVAQPLTTLLTVLLVAIVVAAGTFVAVGEYARKETVEGFLEPDRGAIRVFAPRAGIVSELRVTAGERVERGDVLFKANDLQTLPDGSDADAELLRGFADERDELARGRAREDTRYEVERAGLAGQQRSLAAQIDAAERSIALQSEQQALADEQLDAARVLYERGVLAPADWQTRRGRSLELRDKLQSTRQVLERFRSEQVALETRLRQAPIEHAQHIAEIDARLAAIERAELQARAHRAFEVRAPIGGVVVTVQRKVGDATSPGDAALTMLPNDSTLVGRLLIPSRSIGFVAAGQRVRVRYDAFPYQHFGVFPAVVREVATSVLFAGDSFGPLHVSKPMYPATLALASQTIDAGPRRVRLQSGMQFTADVVLERRTILEWMFEPLLTMRGRGR